jgi:hypothetical protein
MQIYTLNYMPYYERNEYFNILTLNKMPEGPLKDITYRVQNVKLSPFYVNNNCCGYNSCIYALKKDGMFICEKELDYVFEYLLTNNYIIDTSLTKIIQKSSLTNYKNLICYIKYEN